MTKVDRVLSFLNFIFSRFVSFLFFPTHVELLNVLLFSRFVVCFFWTHVELLNSLFSEISLFVDKVSSQYVICNGYSSRWHLLLVVSSA